MCVFCARRKITYISGHGRAKILLKRRRGLWKIIPNCRLSQSLFKTVGFTSVRMTQSDTYSTLVSAVSYSIVGKKNLQGALLEFETLFVSFLLSFSFCLRVDLSEFFVVFFCLFFNHWK